MDNKKLMQILLRDVSELEELVAGIKISGVYDPLDVELLYTRVSGVRHMLEVVSSAETVIKKPEIKEPVKETKTEPIEVKITEIQPVIEQPEPVKTEVKPEIKEEKMVAPPPVTLQESEPEVVTVKEETDNDEMRFEEDDIIAGQQTLGEKFTHGRSVNDLLFEHGKTDYKFSNMPVANLQTAIGINDRFLFTRELFEGNKDAFAETVRKIDSMSSIHDAAVFLRENFKWKKTDTSLKFIELVKRRFV
jgi:hypothetical protein